MIIYPAFPTFDQNNIISFKYDNKFGKDLKKKTRDIVRTSELYKTKIQTDTPIIITTKERTFQVDILGAWLFGTPHYKGNLLFLNNYHKITLKIIDDYKKFPDIVNFINSLELVYNCYLT